MTNDFDNYTERKGTNCLKWDCCAQRFGREDILPMWVADMDFPSPPPVVKAVTERAAHGIYGYTVPSDKLPGLIRDWMKKRHAWEIDPRSIVHSPGVVTSVNTAVLAFTEPGDKVLMQTPIYYPFYSSIADNGRELVRNPLSRSGDRYDIDFEDLERKLASGVRLMIFCSPHNPIGRVWSRGDIEKVTGLCRKYGVILVSDEIHSDLIFKGYKHVPASSVKGAESGRIITLMAPSKTFNVAGLAESFALISDPDLRHSFTATMKKNGSEPLNVFGLSAAEAAYEYGEEWLNDLLVYLEENLNFMENYFREKIPSIKMIRPEATYLAWLDCTSLNIKGNLKDFFSGTARVGLNDGETFGEEGRGFVRLNFACPRTTLEEGLSRIKKAVDSL